jgi:hypothetical protein
MRSFVFRMWRLDPAAAGWETAPPLSVGVDTGGPAELSELSWTTLSGLECSLAFTAGMEGCWGHRRLEDGRVVQVRGEFQDIVTEETLREEHFRTDTLSIGWQSAGVLRLSVDDGDDSALRWVAWRDIEGNAYSVGLTKRSWHGEPATIEVGGKIFAFADTNFCGHRRLAGQDPAAYRGVGIRGNEPPESAPVPAAAEPAAAPAGVPLLPLTGSVPLIRTDFSDDDAWSATRVAVTADRHMSFGDVFSAAVEVVDDRAFEGLTPAQLIRLVPPDADWVLLLVADGTTMTSGEHHVMVVDLDEETAGRTFRATPPAVQEVANNLTHFTMDWEEFADSVDDNGVFHP